MCVVIICIAAPVGDAATTDAVGTSRTTYAAAPRILVASGWVMGSHSDGTAMGVVGSLQRSASASWPTVSPFAGSTSARAP